MKVVLRTAAAEGDANIATAALPCRPSLPGPEQAPALITRQSWWTLTLADDFTDYAVLPLIAGTLFPTRQVPRLHNLVNRAMSPARMIEVLDEIAWRKKEPLWPLVLIGSGAGADYCQKLIAARTNMASAAILLRPQECSPKAPSSPLHGLPILVQPAIGDRAEAVLAAEQVARSMRACGGDVTERWIVGRRALGDSDLRVSQRWLEQVAGRSVALPC